jgi:hypothetical protein
MDIETTDAPSATAHWMPRKIMSEVPLPSSPSTFPINARETPGATPIRVPSTSRPKTVPAQWVPWPCRSPSPVPEKSCCTRSTPANAGCWSSIPVSSTATVTPAPVNGERSAPTARTPQVGPGTAVAGSIPRSAAGTGRTRRVGMTGATARTPGSRATSRSCERSSVATSICVAASASGRSEDERTPP